MITRGTVFASASFLALAISTPAFAQQVDEGAEAEANDPSGLTTIVVTATRQATDLQTTPVAVSALSGGDLQERNVTTLQDVAQFVPSLELVGRPGRGGASSGITIRGIGTDAQDSQASVGVYVDEVFFGSGYGNVLGLLDVQRVEVLRGPQGTLFGRNTIAGAIQYVSNAPTHEFEGYVQGSYGTFDHVSIEGAVNVPVSETLAIRVSGMYDDTDGYVEDLLNDVNLGANRTAAGRVRLRWEPGSSFTLDLKGEYIDVEANGRPTLIDSINPNAQFVFLAGLFGADTSGFNDSLLSPSFSPGDYQTFGYNFPDFFDFKQWLVQGTMSYYVSDNVTLKSITAYQSSEAFFSQDFDLTPVPILAVTTNSEVEIFTQELQLSGTLFDDRLSFTTGAYYFSGEDIGSATQLLSFGLAPLADTTGRGVQETDSIALYGQATFDLTDAFSVSVGLRYTDETTKSSLLNETDPIEFQFTDWSPHFGIQFEASPDAMFYAKASKGFRAGGFTANRSLPGGGLAFNPEEAWTYEAGARLTIADVWRFNPTFFYTDWKDLHSVEIIFTGAGPVATTQNVGDARIQGIEIETELAVTDDLTLNGSYALLDAEYTSINPEVVGGGGVTVNSDLRAVPENKLTVGATYERELSSAVNMILSANYSWTDEQRGATSDAGATTLPSRGLLNGRITAELLDRALSLSLYGNNLTNEYYLIGGNDFARGATAGIRELDVGRPREVGVELRFSF